MKTQLNRGLTRRIMYVENKNGTIDGVAGRVGWVTFSRTGQTVYYRDLTLTKAKGGGIRGNFLNCVSGEEYWIIGHQAAWNERAPCRAGRDRGGRRRACRIPRPEAGVTDKGPI